MIWLITFEKTSRLCTRCRIELVVAFDTWLRDESIALLDMLNGFAELVTVSDNYGSAMVCLFFHFCHSQAGLYA